MNPAYFFAALLVAVALVVWLARRNRQLIQERDEKFARQAWQAGWSFSVNPQYTGFVNLQSGQARERQHDIPFRFEGGQETAPWSMWYDNGLRFRAGAGDAVQPTAAIFECRGVHAPRLAAMILPRSHFRAESGPLLGSIEKFFGAFLALAFGNDEGEARQEFLQRAVEMPGASPQLRESFAVLVGPDTVRGWLDADLQAMLLAWAGPGAPAGVALSMQFGPEGLRVAVRQPPLDDWAFWERLGRLGEALCTRLGAKT